MRARAWESARWRFTFPSSETSLSPFKRQCSQQHSSDVRRVSVDAKYFHKIKQYKTSLIFESQTSYTLDFFRPSYSACKRINLWKTNLIISKRSRRHNVLQTAAVSRLPVIGQVNNVRTPHIGKSQSEIRGIQHQQNNESRQRPENAFRRYFHCGDFD